MVNFVYDENGNKTSAIKNTRRIKAKDAIDIDDLKNFYRATDQYNKSTQAATALENRLKKIDKVLANYKEPIPKKYEVEFLEKDVNAGGEYQYTIKRFTTTFTIDLKKLRVCCFTIKYRTSGGSKDYHKLRYSFIDDSYLEKFNEAYHTKFKDDYAIIKLNDQVIYGSADNPKRFGGSYKWKHYDDCVILKDIHDDCKGQTRTIIGSDSLYNGINILNLEAMIAHSGGIYLNLFCEHD